MLNIETCKKILNKDTNEKFSDEEVKAIRDYLYFLASITSQNNKETNYEL